MESINGIRRRFTTTDSNTLNETDNSSTSTSSSSLNSNGQYQSELQSIRSLMKERIKLQQREDGTVQEEDELEPQVVEEVEAMEGKQQQNQISKTTIRRGSEDDQVREMLLPNDSNQSNVKLGWASAIDNSKETLHEPTTSQNIPPLDESTTNLPPTPPSPTATPSEEKTCRICFDGEDESGESGDLFSPCLCKGTSRFVHVVCLNRWRTASVGSKSFFHCDQCNYEYRISRSSVAGLATNRFALGFVTFFFFTLLIFLAGFIATGMIEAVQARQVRSVFDDYWISDYQIMSESIAEAVNFFGISLEKTTGLPITPPPSSSSNSFLSQFTSSTSKQFVNPNGSSTLLSRTLQHFIKGFSFVGIISFFQTILTSSALGLFGLRGTLFRAVRPNRRNGDNQVSLSQLVIVLFVILGTYKTFLKLYSLVQWGARKVLKRVEGLVMDVGTRETR